MSFKSQWLYHQLGEKYAMISSLQVFGQKTKTPMRNFSVIVPSPRQGVAEAPGAFPLLGPGTYHGVWWLFGKRKGFLLSWDICSAVPHSLIQFQINFFSCCRKFFHLDTVLQEIINSALISHASGVAFGGTEQRHSLWILHLFLFQLLDKQVYGGAVLLSKIFIVVLKNI